MNKLTNASNNKFQGFKSISWVECEDKEYKKIVKILCEIVTPISFKEYVPSWIAICFTVFRPQGGLVERVVGSLKK